MKVFWSQWIVVCYRLYRIFRPYFLVQFALFTLEIDFTTVKRSVIRFFVVSIRHLVVKSFNIILKFMIFKFFKGTYRVWIRLVKTNFLLIICFRSKMRFDYSRNYRLFWSHRFLLQFDLESVDIIISASWSLFYISLRCLWLYPFAGSIFHSFNFFANNYVFIYDRQIKLRKFFYFIFKLLRCFFNFLFH